MSKKTVSVFHHYSPDLVRINEGLRRCRLRRLLTQGFPLVLVGRLEAGDGTINEVIVDRQADGREMVDQRVPVTGRAGTQTGAAQSRRTAVFITTAGRFARRSSSVGSCFEREAARKSFGLPDGPVDACGERYGRKTTSCFLPRRGRTAVRRNLTQPIKYCMGEGPEAEGQGVHQRVRKE